MRVGGILFLRVFEDVRIIFVFFNEVRIGDVRRGVEVVVFIVGVM